MSDQYNDFMPHGAIEEVFPDVFTVMGTMRNEFFGSMWTFGRNMTIVRENGELTLINAVRLNEEGLAALEALGTVKHVMQIGSMHGHDDTFYVHHYNATFWSVPGMPRDERITEARELSEGGPLPFSGAKLFLFTETKLPEAIIFMEKEGGIALACDSLQHWTGPDPFTDESTIETMTKMGFYAPHNLGPAWVHVCEPKPGDFERLAKVDYEHALPAHGFPVVNGADKAFRATFNKVFGV